MRSSEQVAASRGRGASLFALVLSASGFGCESDSELWIALPDAPSASQSVFFVISGANESVVLVRSVPVGEAIRLPFETRNDTPARLQAIFTSYLLSELEQVEGTYQSPSSPGTTLGELEPQVLELVLDGERSSGWLPVEISEPAASLPLSLRLCPEVEFEAVDYQGRFIVEVDESRAALFSETELVWFEWTGEQLETSTVALSAEPLVGHLGRIEDDNTFWFAGSGVYRFELEPRRLTRYAEFDPHVVRDLVLLRPGEDFELLAITEEGELFRVDSSTVTSLGRIPGDRGGVASAGFAVVPAERKVFAAAAGGASYFVYADGAVVEEPFPTLDTEGLAYGATLRGLGPVLVTRPVGDVYVRSPGRAWIHEARIDTRSRRAYDFGGGTVFFDANARFTYYSPEAEVCPVYQGSWDDSGPAAAVGPHLLIATDDAGQPTSSWLISPRRLP